MTTKSFFENEIRRNSRALFSFFTIGAGFASSCMVFIFAAHEFGYLSKAEVNFNTIFILIVTVIHLVLGRLELMGLLEGKSIQKAVIRSKKDDNDLFEGLLFAENYGFKVYEILDDLGADHLERYQLYLIGLMKEKAQSPIPANCAVMKAIQLTKTWKNLNVVEDAGGLMLG